jgi:hypothetical protein
MRTPTLLFISLLFGNGCDSPSAATRVPLGRPFELAPAASTQVDGLTLGFERVAEDSRCPIDALCVWEGDATVVVSLRARSGEPVSFELHTGGGRPREAGFGDYTVRLVALLPALRSDRAIPPADYRATLIVTR